MNLVLDDAETVHIKKKTRKSLGDLFSHFFLIPLIKCPYFKSFLYFHRKDSSQRRQHNSDDEHVKGTDDSS
ncbi:hypothetical protein Pint_31795 [Pistacia integerrima]|uniref:Uncharacterized protein n=1 Tax=Pistacia integerrima TaxID=434235 RepID=A0ACC0XQP8_9ROSI|nr:hypothetical protein Pint_31795 [Pistacia integerrima]